MTKNPISIDKNDLLQKRLTIMNSKKITSLVFMIKKINLKQLGVFTFIIFLDSNIS